MNITDTLEAAGAATQYRLGRKAYCALWQELQERNTGDRYGFITMAHAGRPVIYDQDLEPDGVVVVR